jgi:hypothetical protein
MGSISARQSPRKNKQREKIPRRVRGLIAGDTSESRQNGPKTRQNQGFGRVIPLNETNGFHIRYRPRRQAGQGQQGEK